MVGSLPAVALGAAPEQIHLALALKGSSSYSVMWFNADDEVDYTQVGTVAYDRSFCIRTHIAHQVFCIRTHANDNTF